MSKMLENSLTSIFKSKISPGWYPRDPVKKRERRKKGERRGEVASWLLGAGMDARGSGCSTPLLH